MPSSMIVVALVLAWFVVLVPMIAKHRQQVRRVGGPAMATRVLHRGGRALANARRGPAAGHRSDPYWRNGRGELDQQEDDDQLYSAEDTMDQYDEPTDEMTDDGAEEPVSHEAHGSHAVTRTPDDHRSDAAPRRRGRGGFDVEADAVARHARYAIRQRIVLGLLAAAVLTALLAAVALPVLWWVHVIVDLALVGYLGYLRTQVRIEQEVRERRLNRIGRARLGVHTAHDDEVEDLPQRLRRPGAVVLEIDDEDPAFDELDDYLPVEEEPLRRAAGQ